MIAPATAMTPNTSARTTVMAGRVVRSRTVDTTRSIWSVSCAAQSLVGSSGMGRDTTGRLCTPPAVPLTAAPP